MVNRVKQINEKQHVNLSNTMVYNIKVGGIQENANETKPAIL